LVYKVIQWATGNVGRHSLRGIIQHPDLDLVGVKTYDPAKAGHDAGELVGLPAAGVALTDDAEAIFALEADCVSYNGLGVTQNDLTQTVSDISRFLTSGKNVVTSAIDYLLYPSAMGAGMATPETLTRLQDACAEGNSTLYQSGATPGFSLDAWPIAISRISRVIDHITITEMVDLKTYSSESVLRGFMGFGQPPEPLAPFFEMMYDVEGSAYYPAIRMVSDALGLGLDEVTFSHEFGLTETPYMQATGLVEAGTVSAAKAAYTGRSGGREVFQLQFYWRMSDEIAPDWPTGDGRWTVHIQGDPTIQTEIQVTTEWDTKRATSIMTAMAPINAIPAVCAARPGIKTHLDLPFFGGGYPLPS
jgi:4-hydroxy-tetrahydrodipicolinate reductase